jgi:peptidoglycan-associated lipoprotein
MRSLLLLALLAFIPSCTDDQKKMEEPIAATPEAPADPKNEFTVDENGNVKFNVEIVYFKYDDYTLTEDGKARLNALGDYLKANKGKSLQVQGHCDERGSTEYNLALGELRARSVREYLTTYGVEDNRVKTISFGEEKPAAEGHSEDQWAQNRRADFVLTAAEGESH